MTLNEVRTERRKCVTRRNEKRNRNFEENQNVIISFSNKKQKNKWVLTNKWVFQTKRNTKGQIVKYKA